MSGETRWVDAVADELLSVGEAMGARRGHMFGHPAIYVGRKLAACAYGHGIGIKLPAVKVDALIADGRATPFQPYGKAPMRRWAHLPASDRRDVTEHEDLIAQAIAHLADAEHQ